VETYRSSHPWIDFSVDLQRMDPAFWMCLGEAKSKCDHIAQVPLRSDVAHQLYTVYLAKGVHATTAIEGNTLSEEQVRAQVEGRLELPPAEEYQRQEIINIIDACRSIEERVFGEEMNQALRVEDIVRYNEFVLSDIAQPPEVVPGRIRTHSVVVGNVYKGPPASECGELLQRMCDWLNQAEFIELREKFGVGGSLVRAALAHLYLAWIHPFGDGNGRTARLLEFQILVASGVPSPSAHLLSNHYNRTREQYYAELRRASKEGPNAFLRYALNGFVERLREQITYILEEYLQDLVWRDFVDQSLRDESETLSTRHKELLVALFRSPEPVPKPRLTTLSPRLVQMYATKTEKTLTRDVNVLRDRGLIRRVQGGWVANRELIHQFLPAAAS
jgi:Fic family protein